MSGSTDTPRMSVDVQRLIESLRRCLLARPEILEAYLFGSQAREDAQPHSDIDVAVCVDLDRMADSLFGYAAELTADLVALLQNNDVDVVVLNQAPPLLYHRV